MIDEFKESLLERGAELKLVPSKPVRGPGDPQIGFVLGLISAGLALSLIADITSILLGPIAFAMGIFSIRDTKGQTRDRRLAWWGIAASCVPLMVFIWTVIGLGSR